MAQCNTMFDTDTGRPISHFSHNLEIDNLPQKIKSVADTLSAVKDEVQTRDGRWYRMCIMIHRNKHNRIEGTVLTFVNIDGQKKAQKETIALNSMIKFFSVIPAKLVPGLNREQESMWFQRLSG